MDHSKCFQVFRLLICCLTAGPVLAQFRQPVPVLWMMPVTSRLRGENLTAGVIPAVRMALQDLEKQPPPLGNYEIQLQLLDSQCDAAAALKSLFDTMWLGPQYLLLLGGVCPSVTALIARALPALSLVQVSFAASSPSLSNRKLYKNIFSTMPSDRAVNQATVKLLQRCKWRRVGVITKEGPRQSEMKKDLIRQLMKADVQLVVTESFSDDACSCLKKLQEKDVRIIIGQFDDDAASEVFCCAHRLNLFGARYQWIVAAGEPAGWRLGWRPSRCSTSSLLAAADGSIRLQSRQFSSKTSASVSGRTVQNYQNAYLQHLTEDGSEASPFHPFAYDAVWVAARALSQVTELVKHREKYSVHRNTSVSEEEAGKILLEAVKNTHFEGITGPVFFRNGERMSTIELIQLQGSSGVSVGEFNINTQQLRLMNDLLKFKGQRPARDQTLVLLLHRHVSFILYVVLSSAAVSTTFITLVIICLVMLNRKRWRLISAFASQDELLLLGIMLSSSSVPLSGLNRISLPDQTSLDILCSARLWTLCVGHTVGFAPLFTKTWRVYSLCNTKQKTHLQQTNFVLLCLILLDLLVLTSWQILDPLSLVTIQHSAESDPTNEDAIIQPYSEHCSSIYMDLWLTAIYGYKAPLLGLGCFVSWNIRKTETSSPAVSSKLLALAMFTVTLSSVSGVSGSLLTSHNPPVQFCLISTLILSCNIFILCLLFGPQIRCLLCSSDKLQQVCDLEEKVPAEEDEDELRRLNQQLKSLSSELDFQIEAIAQQLCEMSVPEFLHLLDNRPAAGGQVSIHDVQICSYRISEEKNLTPVNINSPEHVQRRLSVQLPILHHSYLPAVGGVSTSSSSLFANQEDFLYI